ncbi:MAG: hypothetical protein KDA99_26040, partial [Planctomycetales bacterium]|nr:hypothetical protein [Planctomycetales bacterium]
RVRNVSKYRDAVPNDCPSQIRHAHLLFLRKFVPAIANALQRSVPQPDLYSMALSPTTVLPSFFLQRLLFLPGSNWLLLPNMI